MRKKRRNPVMRYEGTTIIGRRCFVFVNGHAGNDMGPDRQGDIAVVTGERDGHFLGHWIYSLLNPAVSKEPNRGLEFPKGNCRPLTGQEKHSVIRSGCCTTDDPDTLAEISRVVAFIGLLDDVGSQSC